VLDNFEHLLEAAPLVGDLLKTAPGVRVLATSRERLNLSGETVFPLAGMSVPEHVGLGPVSDFSGIKLFVESARRVKLDFQLTGEVVRRKGECVPSPLRYAFSNTRANLGRVARIAGVASNIGQCWAPLVWKCQWPPRRE
jgi:hypothetical protein